MLLYELLQWTLNREQMRVVQTDARIINVKQTHIFSLVKRI